MPEGLSADGVGKEIAGSTPSTLPVSTLGATA